MRCDEYRAYFADSVHGNKSRDLELQAHEAHCRGCSVWTEKELTREISDILAAVDPTKKQPSYDMLFARAIASL